MKQKMSADERFDRINQNFFEVEQTPRVICISHETQLEHIVCDVVITERDDDTNDEYSREIKYGKDYVARAIVNKMLKDNAISFSMYKDESYNADYKKESTLRGTAHVVNLSK